MSLSENRERLIDLISLLHRPRKWMITIYYIMANHADIHHISGLNPFQSVTLFAPSQTTLKPLLASPRISSDYSSFGVIRKPVTTSATLQHARVLYIRVTRYEPGKPRPVHHIQGLIATSDGIASPYVSAAGYWHRVQYAKMGINEEETMSELNLHIIDEELWSG